MKGYEVGDIRVPRGGLRMTRAANVAAKIECVNAPDVRISKFSGLPYWDDEEDDETPAPSA